MRISLCQSGNKSWLNLARWYFWIQWSRANLSISSQKITLWKNRVLALNTWWYTWRSSTLIRFRKDRSLFKSFCSREKLIKLLQWSWASFSKRAKTVSVSLTTYLPKTKTALWTEFILRCLPVVVTTPTLRPLFSNSMEIILATSKDRSPRYIWNSLYRFLRSSSSTLRSLICSSKVTI